MASFTDQVQTFNPYVSQLPVEAMVQVGMQKQAQYDAGVQKIQGYIDNIAGMDVYRPQDKEMLQSKLNELGSKLKTVAAGDFSNQQLVNSVGGMATNIIKDPYVQNAVSSTANYRKALEERKAYQKEGKTSPSNDLDFQQRHDAWVNGDANATFSGGYDPYTNWKKEGVEILKSLTGDSTITEEAFTPKLDKDGKPVLDATGKPVMVLADAIKVEKYKGLSPEKIQQALQVGLSPAAMKQMELDGKYFYNGYKTQDEVKGLIQSNFDSKRKMFVEKKDKLEELLGQTGDATIKEDIRTKIKEVNKYISSYDSQQSKLMKLADANQLDSAKANLFSIDSLAEFSNAFSYREVEEGWKNSPLAEMQFKRDVRNQEHQEFLTKLNNDNYWKGMEYRQEERKIASQDKLNQALLGGLLSDIPQEELPKVTTGKIIADVTRDSQQLSLSDAQFLKAHGGKDAAWLSAQRAAWEARPNGVDADIAAYFNQTEGLRRNVETKGRMITEITKAADAKYGTVNKFIPERAPVVSYKSTNLDFKYTPQELANFAASSNNFVTITNPTELGGKASVSYDTKAAQANLSPKEYKLWRAYHGLDKSAADSKLKEVASWYNKNVYNPYSGTLSKKNEEIANEVYRRISVGQGVEYTVPTFNPAQKGQASGFLLSAAKLADAQSGRLPGSTGTADDLKLIASDLENVTVKVAGGTEYQPTSYRVTALGKKGQTVSFTLSPEQKRASMGNLFDMSSAAQAAMPYIETLKMLGGNTTATDGSSSSNEYNSYMSNIDFPNVKTYGIKANLVPRGDGYGFRLSISNPITKKWIRDIPYPAAGSPAMSPEDITNQRLGFTDAALYEIINDRPATARDLQIIQKASKNPF